MILQKSDSFWQKPEFFTPTVFHKVPNTSAASKIPLQKISFFGKNEICTLKFKLIRFNFLTLLKLRV